MPATGETANAARLVAMRDELGNHALEALGEVGRHVDFAGCCLHDYEAAAS